MPKEKKKHLFSCHTESINLDIEMDSLEEVQFAHWLVEAEAYGYIYGWLYHDCEFKLFHKVSTHITVEYTTKKLGIKKTKEINKHLFGPHSYKPDFTVYPYPKLDNFNHGLILYGKCFIVDVKGAYEPQSAKKQVFSINQKWTWQRYGVYVNKLIPEKFFKKTWVPAECAWIKGRKIPTRIKRYSGCKLIKDIC